MASWRLSEEVDRTTTSPLQGESSSQPEETKIEDQEMQNRFDRLIIGANAFMIGEDAKENEPSAKPVYFHWGCELCAVEIDKHLAVLPGVAISSMELAIYDVQAVDPGIVSAEDQDLWLQRTKTSLYADIKFINHS